jgi:hypothetical protein
MCSVAVSLCLLLSLPACDSQPCDEAQQKLESCVEKVNCNTADPMEIDTCRKAVQQAEDLLKEMEGAPCVLEIKDRAENYANCPVDPVTYCQC